MQKKKNPNKPYLHSEVKLYVRLCADKSQVMFCNRMSTGATCNTAD